MQNIPALSERKLMKKLTLMIGIGFLTIQTLLAAETNAPLRFILDMVHDNPGEPRFVTKFNDPAVLKQWGYNGQCPKFYLQAATTYDKFDPTLLPKGSKERAFCEAEAARIDEKIKAAKAVQMPLYPFTDVLVVPKSLMKKYGAEMKSGGRLSILKPMTQKVVRAQINDIFDRFPDLAGITLRFGETYLHDAPYHAGSSPVNSIQEHIVLINLFREEVCVKRNKVMFYRTWSFGNNFHTNPDFYLKVTDQIEPHPNLIFSIKHTQGDYTRDVGFNPCLGIGKHPQLVEVSCNQAGLYGKNCWPYYIGKGVIDGWSSWDAGKGDKGLRSLTGNPHWAGVWTWTRGDGWAGPFTPNEFWVDLNAYVISHFGQSPGRSEEDIFNEYCREKLKLDAGQTAKFREVCLLATAATYHGQESGLFKSRSWWCRDEYLTALNLKEVADRGLEEKVLAEKAQADSDWKRVERMAREIKLSNPADQEFLEISSTYGRIKMAITEQIWKMQLLAAQARKSGKLDKAKMAEAIKTYDALWTEWRKLKSDHACCPTLYRDNKAKYCGPPFKSVLDSYRKQVAK